MSARQACVLALAALAACGNVGAQQITAPKVTVGDQWVYEVTDSSGRASVQTAEVVRAGADGVVVRRGGTDITYSAPWTMVRTTGAQVSASIEPGLVTVPFPLEIGRVVTQKVTVRLDPGGQARLDETVTSVFGWEDVKVPAGSFRAVKIHRTEVNGAGSPNAARREGTYWYAPEVRSHVQVENIDAGRGLRVTHKLQRYRLN